MTRVALFFLLALTLTCAPPHVGLPPIPRSVPSQLGRIPIIWVDTLKDPDSGQLLWGAFSPSTRTIYLSTQARGNLPFAWQILRHEVVHVVLMDSGLRHLMPPLIVQAIADAMATRQVHEMLVRWP